VYHNGGPRFANDDRLGLSLPGRFLHGRNDAAGHALLAQVDEIVGVGGLRHSIGSDVVDDQFLVDAALGHRDHIFGRNGPRSELASELGFNLGAILGFDRIEFRTNDGAAQGSNSRTNRSPRPSVARSVPYEGSSSRTDQTAQQGSLICPVGRSAACRSQQKKGQCPKRSSIGEAHVGGLRPQRMYVEGWFFRHHRRAPRTRMSRGDYLRLGYGVKSNWAIQGKYSESEM
jgi:hypothetical protein